MVRFIRLLLNEKGRFLWSAHRITERQKAGKVRSIKGKQLKNSRSTVSKQLVALRSSASDNSNEYQKRANFPENIEFSGISLYSDKSIRHHKNTRNEIDSFVMLTLEIILVFNIRTTGSIKSKSKSGNNANIVIKNEVW